MAKKYDAIIIGTGQAGPSLAGELAGKGWHVAVIERKRFHAIGLPPGFGNNLICY